jgi:purine-binding chemotaxis protein CheW
MNTELNDIDILNESDEDTQKDKFLTFFIANEIYAVDVKYVIEIIGIQKITFVPNIKNYIKGIINLRGNITPVVDVRLRFQMNEIEYNDRTCIIVLHYNTSSVGLIVDEVSEVLNIPSTVVSLPPQTSKGTQSRFIQGIGKLGDDMKIILNIHKLLYDDNEKAYDIT